MPRLACLWLALNKSNDFPCFGDFVSFRSFRLFWRFRFSGFVSLFRVLVHAVNQALARDPVRKSYIFPFVNCNALQIILLFTAKPTCTCMFMLEMLL